MQALALILTIISTIGIYIGGCTGNTQPHFVLIVADDLGWSDVSWHNNYVQTNTMDYLAYEGIRLNRSYVQSACSPTRGALLCSKYAFRLGMQGDPIGLLQPTGLDLDCKLLSEALEELGYETYAIGKWHLGYCDLAYTPNERGFRQFYGFYGGSQRYFTHETSGYYDFWYNYELITDQNGVYSTKSFGDKAVSLIESRNSSEPMFLYLPFQSVHSPLQCPDEFVDLYDHLPVNHTRKTYLGMVSAMDDAIGRIVDALNTTGHLDNTVIVFLSDNGGSYLEEGYNYPLRGKKGSNTEGSTRTVGFVYSPLISNDTGVIGSESNNLIHVTDWYPTFVGLAGGNTDGLDIDGVDQWFALNGITTSARDEMVYNIDITNGPSGSVRINDFKLVIGPFGRAEWVAPPEMNVLEDTTTTSITGSPFTWRDFINSRPTEYDCWVQNLPDATKYMTNMARLRVYDVSADPEERHDLAGQDLDVMAELLYLFLDKLQFEYVPVDDPRENCAGHPSNWGNGVWTPGWCMNDTVSATHGNSREASCED